MEGAGTVPVQCSVSGTLPSSGSRGLASSPLVGNGGGGLEQPRELLRLLERSCAGTTDVDGSGGGVASEASSVTPSSPGSASLPASPSPAGPSSPRSKGGAPGAAEQEPCPLDLAACAQTASAPLDLVGFVSPDPTHGGDSWRGSEGRVAALLRAQELEREQWSRVHASLKASPFSSLR